MTAPLRATGDEPARVGRPRDPSRDAVILRATLDLLAEGGAGAVTMEAVAARAGVGKATLYRRWPSRDPLVVDALAELNEPLSAPRDASVRDQLATMLATVTKRHTSLAGRIFPRLVSEAVDNPDLMRMYRERVMEPRRARFRAVLERGVAEGVVRADADLDHVIDLLIGPVAYRGLIRTEPPVGPDFAARVVDDVLAGLTPRPEETA